MNYQTSEMAGNCFFQVRHLQRVRRKRRLERELLHQYSYPNSEADDMEEQNIGEIESVVNAQFVAYSDPADKNIYDDSPEVRSFGCISSLFQYLCGFLLSLSRVVKKQRKPAMLLVTFIFLLASIHW